MLSSRLIAGLLALIVTGLLLYVLRGVLLPFVAGMLVAYFLDPVADRLEKWGCSRTIAVSIITAVFFLSVALVFVLLIPPLQMQIVGLVTRAPSYLDAVRERAQPILEGFLATLPPEDLDRIRNVLGSYAGEAIQWVGALLKGVWRGGMALLNLLSLVFITPLVAFYLLRDWDRIITRVDDMLPRDVAPVVRKLASEIDDTMSAFLRGQATVCLLLGVFYAAGLTLVGLDFGLAVGFGTGLISFIPYFGMAVGLVVGMGIAVAQFSEWLPIVLVAAVFAAGQVLEGNFVTPKLVGDKVGLHPVWVIFALLAGGALFGFTGVLLAIPVGAAIGVIVRHAALHYRESHLYDVELGFVGGGGKGDEVGDEAPENGDREDNGREESGRPESPGS